MSAVSLIPELDEVIQHGSLGRRAETLRRIADLFVQGASRFNQDHIELFEQVFQRLIKEVDCAARTELAHRLSVIAGAPPGVVRGLAGEDDIATAAPILAYSHALKECDLAQIAQTKGQPHLLAVAKRRQLTPVVTDKLLERGDREVLRALADNPSANFSEPGYAALIEKAGHDGTLAEKVTQRRDLPPRLLRDLVLGAAPAVRERLLATAPVEKQAEMRRALAEVADGAEAKTARRDYTAAEREILELRCEGKLDEARLVEFAVGGRYDETVAGLASLCAVPIDVVDRLMNADRVDPILILCKSVGWSWQTVETLIAARPRAEAISSRDVDLAYDNFERLSPTTAQRVMRFWQVQHWRRRTDEE